MAAELIHGPVQLGVERSRQLSARARGPTSLHAY
jgi:hypothetical protein